jgi:EAL domain-containing protein (putative c-di-GMP-specific phosphodiesterase class I)
VLAGLDLIAAQVLEHRLGGVLTRVPAEMLSACAEDLYPQSAAAAAAGVPVLVDDWTVERGFAPSAIVRGLGIGSTLAIPLAGAQNRWVVELHALSAAAFRSDHMRLARSLGHLLSPQPVRTAPSRAAAVGGSVKARRGRRSAHQTGDRGELPASAVREALRRERLVLHAQPILDLGSGEIVQEELLVRMRGAEGGLILPGRFLPAAEADGLISEIDRWVLDRACRLAASGRRVQMNVSARTVNEPSFVDVAEDAISRHEAPPRNLTLEITETALIDDIATAKCFATRLTQLGCRFALDDFGTGFAPLTYLKQLPISYLKIDLEFVRDILANQRSQALAQAIVHLAGTLGLRTIAEGVEDELTLRYLRRLGVDYAQGYLIGRPRGVEEDQPRVVTARSG